MSESQSVFWPPAATLTALWRRQRVRWATVIAWMAVIFYLSSRSDFPDVLHVRPDWQDVIAHAVIFGVLAVLWYEALDGAGVRRPVLWALVMTALYGASDEFHQLFVPGRHADILDILTDMAGASAGLWGVTRLRSRRSLRKGLTTRQAQER